MSIESSLGRRKVRISSQPSYLILRAPRLLAARICDPRARCGAGRANLAPFYFIPKRTKTQKSRQTRDLRVLKDAPQPGVITRLRVCLTARMIVRCE
jgi:hypothetical protein